MSVAVLRTASPDAVRQPPVAVPDGTVEPSIGPAAAPTHPTNEFTTPYRIINYHACNGCWNDPHHRFDHKDFLWCPRHQDTPRQFECTRLITAKHVKATPRSIPGFGVHKTSRTVSAVSDSVASNKPARRRT